MLLVISSPTVSPSPENSSTISSGLSSSTSPSSGVESIRVSWAQAGAARTIPSPSAPAPASPASLAPRGIQDRPGRPISDGAAGFPEQVRREPVRAAFIAVFVMMMSFIARLDHRRLCAHDAFGLRRPDKGAGDQAMTSGGPRTVRGPAPGQSRSTQRGSAARAGLRCGATASAGTRSSRNGRNATASAIRARRISPWRMTR